MERYPDTETIHSTRRKLLRWKTDHSRDFPWRNPDMNWHGLIAEILLQRTWAENVVPVYSEFTDRYPTIEAFADASKEELEDLIEPLGLKKRATSLSNLGNRLREIGGIPEDREELLDLPGVGPYTAAAWISLHRDKRAVLIDSNVIRWLCRMIGHEYDRSLRREEWIRELAGKITPDTEVRDYNYAVLDLAREICTPSNPQCVDCPLGSDLCEYARSDPDQ